MTLLKHLAKGIIPAQHFETLRLWRRKLNLSFLPLWASSPYLSSLFYALIDHSFIREHYGVIVGKQRYYKDLEEAKASQFLLRRNIHRLEKGLISKPRRDVFARDYIEETVTAYKRMLTYADTTLDIGTEARWAHDVLVQYFSVTASHPNLDRARASFEALETAPPESCQMAPYQRDLSQQPINYDAFFALTRKRRSVRWYLDKAVPREMIDKSITAAMQSPSACNRLPFEFRVFDDPELVQKVAGVPGGTVGFSHNFPVIVVVIGKLRAYFAERDRHLIYIDGALASMTFMYALETQGLSSCPINWPDVPDKERDLKTLLKLEADERPIMFISLGYPDPNGLVPYSQKKPLEQIRSYNVL